MPKPANLTRGSFRSTVHTVCMYVWNKLCGWLVGPVMHECMYTHLHELTSSSDRSEA